MREVRRRNRPNGWQLSEAERHSRAADCQCQARVELESQADGGIGGGHRKRRDERNSREAEEAKRPIIMKRHQNMRRPQRAAIIEAPAKSGIEWQASTAQASAGGINSTHNLSNAEVSAGSGMREGRALTPARESDRRPLASNNEPGIIQSRGRPSAKPDRRQTRRGVLRPGGARSSALSSADDRGIAAIAGRFLRRGDGGDSRAVMAKSAVGNESYPATTERPVDSTSSPKCG